MRVTTSAPPTRVRFTWARVRNYRCQHRPLRKHVELLPHITISPSTLSTVPPVADGQRTRRTSLMKSSPTSYRLSVNTSIRSRWRFQPRDLFRTGKTRYLKLQACPIFPRHSISWDWLFEVNRR